MDTPFLSSVSCYVCVCSGQDCLLPVSDNTSCLCQLTSFILLLQLFLHPAALFVSVVLRSSRSCFAACLQAADRNETCLLLISGHVGHLPDTSLFLFSLWFPAGLFCPAGPHSPAACSLAGFSVLPAPLCQSCCLPRRTENPIGFWLLSDWVDDPACFSESRLVIVN